jgi:hypothetical protein
VLIQLVSRWADLHSELRRIHPAFAVLHFKNRRHRVLPSSDMFANPQFATAAYASVAVLAWGTSDFLGGYATRRANAFLFTVVVNIGGLLLVGTLALTAHAPFPTGRSVAWVLAGGIS